VLKCSHFSPPGKCSNYQLDRSSGFDFYRGTDGRTDGGCPNAY
jgi:hypothetical protein